MLDSEIYNHFAHPMNANSPTNFSCLQCGECCLDRRQDPIILSGYDMYRLAKALGKHTTLELLEDGTVVVSRGHFSNMPVHTLNTSSSGACILSKGNRCSVHLDKPIVCALFPFGRVFDSEEQKYTYFRGRSVCNGCFPSVASEQTFASWLRQFHVQESEPYYTAAAAALAECAKYYINISRPWLQKKAYVKITCALYAFFDTEKPYLPQLEANMHNLRPFLHRAAKKKWIFHHKEDNHGYRANSE